MDDRPSPHLSTFPNAKGGRAVRAWPSIKILLSRKNRPALFHERAPAFGIVLALKTAADQLLAHLGVEVRRRLEDFTDHRLGGTHGQRRIGSQCRRVFGQQCSERIRWADAVD